MNKAASLKKLIEKITHSGADELNSNELKEIIDHCKTSEEEIKKAFEFSFKFLNKKHSEVRLSCVQLMDSLFLEFPAFQRLLLDDLKNFVSLTMGLKDKPLPPPKPAAKNLAKLSIQVFNKWFLKYGNKFIQLVMAEDYLSRIEHVDFKEMEVIDPSEKAKRDESNRRNSIINRERAKSTKAELDRMEPIILESITCLENCLSLLIPSLEEEAPDTTSSSASGMRLFGVTRPNQTLELELDLSLKVVQTEDNSTILENAQERYKAIVNKYLPKTKAWTEVLSRVGEEGRVEGLRTALEGVAAKYEKIQVVREGEEEEVSTDSELEEVVDESVPGPSSQTSRPLRRPDKRSKPLTWEESRPPSKLVCSTLESIWTSNSLAGEELPLPDILQTNFVQISSDFEPVERCCSAPLPSGKLCPRRDRLKCPFHGPIVPRDSSGQPLNPQDVPTPVASTPDWQDPRLLARIKAETGLDLKVGRPKSKKRHPGLTDIKKESPAQRISKKIFNKKTLRRVARTLDQMDSRR